MARYKTYSPLSHGINDDPEMWEFTEKFGDRSLRFVLEIFILLDKKENDLLVTDELIKTISRRVRQTVAKCWRQLRHMLTAGWLQCGDGVVTNSPMRVSARNYAEYHNYVSPAKDKYQVPTSHHITKQNNKKETGVASLPPTCADLPIEKKPRGKGKPKRLTPDQLQAKIDELLKVQPWKNNLEPKAFEYLWGLWPKKDGKAEAKIAWLTVRPESENVQTMEKQIEGRKARGEWVGEDQRYCPRLDNYLYEKRWMDGV